MSKDEHEILGLLTSPILLAWDNFTPLTQTPWAGSYIASHFKDALLANSSASLTSTLAIGESWEFSCDPKFPSRLCKSYGNSVDLPHLVSLFPKEILSPTLAASTKSPTCEILVKILNAAMPLSFQLHPDDHDSQLKPGECGKPESWLILAAERGAGIFLGFSHAFNLKDLERALISGEDISRFFNFVPVQPGEYYDLAPGVPHAIGAGITLLEPQRILAGKSGKTYRLWDWGRKYDAAGHLDTQHGKPREIHIEASLRLLHAQEKSRSLSDRRNFGEAFVRQCRLAPSKREFSPKLSIKSFPANHYYQLHYLTADSPKESHHLSLSIENGYGVLLSLEGTCTLSRAGKKVTLLPKGRSALLPHLSFAEGPLNFTFKERATLALIAPSTASCQFA